MTKIQAATLAAAMSGSIRIVATGEECPPYHRAHMRMLFEACPCGQKHVAKIARGLIWLVCPEAVVLLAEDANSHTR